MKASLQIKGIDKLMSKLEKNMTLKDVENVVSRNGMQLNRVMKEKAQFKGHYQNGKFISPTGATRRSITTNKIENGMGTVTYPRTEYAPYLEYGTRKMSAQPFVKPAFAIQKLIFLKDLERLMK